MSETVFIPEDYPEPSDALHDCIFCGKKTRQAPVFGPNPYRPGYNIAIPAHCARSSCLVAFDKFELHHHLATEMPS